MRGARALALWLAGKRDGTEDHRDETGGVADVVERGPTQVEYPVRDLEAQAALATYDSGARKLTRYPRANLSKRRVVIVLHQTGVERAESSKRWHLVTGHRVISPTGTRMRLFPLTTRLVAANRFDRAPWHGISIEVAGNFEEFDGDGKWWRPGIYGKGRASDAQLEACCQEVRVICDEVSDLGGRVEGLAPHRVSGIGRDGRPNKPFCPGSRVWSEVGERMACELGLAVPGAGWTLGGLAVPIDWRSPRWKPWNHF
jgi:hypothetical protein